MRRACITWTFALCLAVYISVLFYSPELVQIHAAGGSFNVTSLTPTPSPSPTPSPAPTASPTPTSTPTTPPVTPTPSPSATPTSTPTTTPTPTPTDSGNGSSQPSISLRLHINMIGQKTDWLCTSTGKLLEDVSATSPDGRLTLRIYRDTFVLYANGEPLTEINSTAVDPLMTAPPLIPPTGTYLIYVYEFLPEDANFSKPIEIEVTYNLSDLPKSPDELTLRMYVLNDALNEWEALPWLSDIETNPLICTTSHLSIYALIAAPLEGPTPIPQPTSLEQHSYWMLPTLILFATALMFFTYILFKRRRKSTASKDSD